MSAGPGRSTGIPRVAHTLCALAVAVLGRPDRARYREEWQADLAADPDHAVSYASSLLGHAVLLRLTLSGHLHPERPLSCRLGRHHYLTVHDNSENMRFTSHRCERCGDIKDDWRGREQVGPQSFAWGNAAGGLR